MNFDQIELCLLVVDVSGSMEKEDWIGEELVIQILLLIDRYKFHKF